MFRHEGQFELRVNRWVFLKQFTLEEKRNESHYLLTCIPGMPEFVLQYYVEEHLH
jgi:hypothetical protein